MPARGSNAPRARLRGFAPVIDAGVETLILGSFPSEASLAAGQYYAHPRNQFWRILGAVLGEPLAELPYAARLERVLAHRIGIWDVIDACEREGSADSAIRNARANDFRRLRALAPKLGRVIFNGGRAGRFEPRFRAAGFVTRIVPSSSPAHASRTLAQKISLWRRALADGRETGHGKVRRSAKR
ncbi:MAG TPA: DNA-deoxyinosine glycosylase [Burkholderiaceae bacterium]|jgi:hypoxanthine-DNA glycosylase|nr:DNA-deoxyinosine glycosylase [Burkholderiaceae bacterium]